MAVEKESVPPSESGAPAAGRGMVAAREVSPTKRYWEIFDGKETYSPGSAIEQATRYRIDHLLEPTVERIRKELLARAADALQPVQLLVSLGGFSPETTIIACAVFRPANLFLVSTAEAYSNINLIAPVLFEGGLLTPAAFQHEKCSPTDAMDVFNTVRRALEKARPSSVGRYLVDVTGGKKVMSATAAQAAWEAGVAICYIDSKQDPERRVSVPGTERMILLDNPSIVVGRSQLEQAHHLFDHGVYDAARTQYAVLAQKLAEPATARLMRDVAALYSQWRAFNLPGLTIALTEVQRTLDSRGPFEVPVVFRSSLDAQMGFLSRLIDKDPVTLTVAVFALARDYARFERYDFATLLYYRTLEACFAEQLERGHHVKASGFERSSLGGDADVIEERYRTLVTKMTRAADPGPVPFRIGCFEAMVLLRALEDPMLKSANLTDEGALRHLYGLLVARNRSVLAHGFEPVSADACEKLRAQAERVLAASLLTWGKGELEDELRPATFARIMSRS